MAHTTTNLEVGKGMLRTWYFKSETRVHLEHNTSVPVSCDPCFMEHLEHNTRIQHCTKALTQFNSVALWPRRRE